jgi:hypothetical protein
MDEMDVNAEALLARQIFELVRATADAVVKRAEETKKTLSPYAIEQHLLLYLVCQLKNRLRDVTAAVLAERQGDADDDNDFPQSLVQQVAEAMAIYEGSMDDQPFMLKAEELLRMFESTEGRRLSGN